MFLLPSAEAILRDFLIGREWMRAKGMEQESKLAYFIDSFGWTLTLPSLLIALRSLGLMGPGRVSRRNS